MMAGVEMTCAQAHMIAFMAGPTQRIVVRRVEADEPGVVRARVVPASAELLVDSVGVAVRWENAPAEERG